MNRFTILVTGFLISFCLSGYGQSSNIYNKLLRQYLNVQQKRIGFQFTFQTDEEGSKIGLIANGRC